MEHAATRSVKSLSNAQLLRKRANDREAQRAIRARTKEKIARLEQDKTVLEERVRLLESLSHDEMVQRLMTRIRGLEQENGNLKRENDYLQRLHPSQGMSQGMLLSGMALNDLPMYPSDSSSRASSSFCPEPVDYSNPARSVPPTHMSTPHMPTPQSSESWEDDVLAPTFSRPSTVPSPALTGAPGDDIRWDYVPTSQPAVSTSQPATLVAAESLPGPMILPGLEDNRERDSSTAPPVDSGFGQQGSLLPRGTGPQVEYSFSQQNSLPPPGTYVEPPQWPHYPPPPRPSQYM